MLQRSFKEIAKLCHIHAKTNLLRKEMNLQLDNIFLKGLMRLREENLSLLLAAGSVVVLLLSSVVVGAVVLVLLVVVLVLPVVVLLVLLVLVLVAGADVVVVVVVLVNAEAGMRAVKKQRSELFKVVDF